MRTERDAFKSGFSDTFAICEKYVADFLIGIGVSEAITENPLCRYELKKLAVDYLKSQDLIDPEKDSFKTDNSEEIKQALSKIFRWNNGVLKYNNYLGNGLTKNVEYKVQEEGNIFISDRELRQYFISDAPDNDVTFIDRQVDKYGIETYRKETKGPAHGAKQETVIQRDPTNLGVFLVEHKPNDNIDGYINYRVFADFEHINRLIIKQYYKNKLEELKEKFKWYSDIEEGMKDAFRSIYDDYESKKWVSKQLQGKHAKCEGPERSHKTRAEIECRAVEQGLIEGDIRKMREAV